MKNLTTIVKETSVNISWTSSGNNECVIPYLILIFNSTSEREEIVYNETTKNNYFNAINLLPCVKYTIVVKVLENSESSKETNATVITKLISKSIFH